MRTGFEIAGVVATVLAVTGVLLNNRLNRLCFVLWMISNLLCGLLHATVGLWSMVVRDAVFVVLAIEGFYKWRNHKKKLSP